MSISGYAGRVARSPEMEDETILPNVVLWLALDSDGRSLAGANAAMPAMFTSGA